MISRDPAVITLCSTWRKPSLLLCENLIQPTLRSLERLGVNLPKPENLILSFIAG